MRSKEQMLTLISEIEEELKNIQVLEESISNLRPRITNVAEEDRRYLIESAALEFHNFYLACERIFEKIAVEINGGISPTPDWHSRLLNNMALEIKEIRPPVLTKDLARDLQEYLKFRHLVTSIYGFELDFERMKPLIKNLPRVTNMFKKEIKHFLHFLKSITS